ncbi:HD domain-containing protein [Rickettsia endosymbiont of Polydrusus tereticollis]|uniref:HD domain-containing protein n=1 Tax=Rickettsia endosymbiont of Polydrusus tereticollis TaxID=3066251 RepID=UPI00313315E1
MEDINCWEEKFEMCGYATRLLDKITYLNRLVKPPIDIGEVKKGLYYARKYHGVQIRQSGDPYYSHPVEVAYMAAKYSSLQKQEFFRTDMIVTALLHDTIEDTEFTKTMITNIFGYKIACQVEDLTRIKLDKKISSAEMVHSLLLQNNKDMLFIKVFDRLHNMQTIGVKSPEKMKKIMLETLSVFITLSMHLGMPQIKDELIELYLKATPTLKDNFLQPFLTAQNAVYRIRNLYLPESQ